jgi:hypothetical protein
MIFKMLAECGFTPCGRQADLQIQTCRWLVCVGLHLWAQPGLTSSFFVPLYR